MAYDHAYCINLVRDAEKRDKIEREFKAQNIDVEFIKAFDSKENGITKDNVRPEIHPGEFGCLMSNYMVWNDMLEKGYKSVLIMEDDIELVPRFKDIVNTIEFPKEWDVIYLEYVSPVYDAPSTKDVHEGRCLGTMCYLISESGAKKLFLFDPKDWRGADKQLAQIPLKSFYSIKRLARHDLLNSGIGVSLDRIPIFHNILWFTQTFGTYIGLVIFTILIYTLYLRLYAHYK
jgi:hypothetical protein